MSVARLHTLHVIQGHMDGDTPATVLGGIVSQAINLGTETRALITSGEVFARFLSIVAQNPGATFATHAIAKALAYVGLNGKRILSTTNPGLNLFAQAKQEGAARTTGSTHRKYNIREGLIIPTSLTVDHQGDVIINYQVLATTDDTNDPIIETDSVALPTGIVDDERFTIGPITLESVLIPQVKSLNIEFGVQARAEGSDSDKHPTFAVIDSIQPVININGVDAEWLKAANIPRNGLAITHANTSIFLRKRAQGGTFVADGTAEHIKFTGDGIAHVSQSFGASSPNDGEVSITIPLHNDGTNDPLLIVTASAIS